MTAIPLFDCHVQLGRHPRTPVNIVDVATLLPQMDRFGIQQAVVGSTTAVLHDPSQGNEQTMAMVSDPDAAGRLLPALTLLPPTPGEPGEPALDAVRAERVASVRMYPHTHAFDPASKDLEPLFDALSRLRVPLVVEVAELPWQQLSTLARRWPQLPLGVTGIGYRALRQLAPLLSRHPNLFVTTAGFSTHEGIEWFVEHFGPLRLLFATGASRGDVGEAVGRLMWSGLDPTELQQVAFRNASTLFRLPLAVAR